VSGPGAKKTEHARVNAYSRGCGGRAPPHHGSRSIRVKGAPPSDLRYSITLGHFCTMGTSVHYVIKSRQILSEQGMTYATYVHTDVNGVGPHLTSLVDRLNSGYITISFIF